MSSYLPPDNDLPSFNSDEFPESLSNGEVKVILDDIEAKTEVYNDEQFPMKTTASRQLIVCGEFPTFQGNPNTVSFGVTFDSPPSVFVQMMSNSSTNGYTANLDITESQFVCRKFFARINTDNYRSAGFEGFYWMAIGTVST